ncbi:spore-associated protein A [Nonomuraea antimicrobica]|uniref:Spore-associated protein A n=1 Tax=Nonomuraea antimicrobica TaxID=561173 RepID=A0ABP7BMZ7_9ACTN
MKGNDLRTRRKVAALASMVMVASWLIVSATPASAAGECGAGYRKVGNYKIGSVGALEVYYNSSNGKNCAITRASRPSSGYKQAAISVENQPWADYDEGNFKYYAGPVYVDARGKCIDVQGYIGRTYVLKETVHCD